MEGSAGSGNAGLTLYYGYLSDGTKTSSVTGTRSNAGGLKYRGSFVYELKDGAERISSIGWSEGRTEYVYAPFLVEDGDVVLEGPEDLLEIDDLWYIPDHLGNTRTVVLMDWNGGTILEQNEYLPFGTRLANPAFEQYSSNRYRFAGKEEQRFGTFDLTLSDFGARYYDPFTARWTARDPMAGKYHSLSPYNYCAGNPVSLVDPDGLSTHADSTGLVVAVYDDGDNGVYRHQISSNTYDGSYLDSSDGVYVGKTLFWDEFISPETGKVMNDCMILFDKSFDSQITYLSTIADGLDLSLIAFFSSPGRMFDIKSKVGSVGALLHGYYVTSRSAGNYLAGYNAAKGSFLGEPISYSLFQRLAGALHIKGPNLSALLGVLINGDSFGDAPTFGEEVYQYRMSKIGWEDGLIVNSFKSIK